MEAVKKVDWFCPKCNSYVSSESVTFEETHQICKTEVILEPLNQNKMSQDQKAIRDILIVSGALFLITGVFIYIGLIG